MRSVISGKSGEKGSAKHCHGKNAEHTLIPVPLRTLFRNKADGKFVIELTEEGEQFVAARGGAGGKGNAFFLSNEIRAPMVRELGGVGERKEFTVEMRVIAHVGLVSAMVLFRTSNTQ